MNELIRISELTTKSPVRWFLQYWPGNPNYKFWDSYLHDQCKLVHTSENNPFTNA